MYTNSRYSHGASTRGRRGRGGRGAAAGHGLSGQPRGLFEAGVWKCDCFPRQPAERFQVKKDNQNHGRWFYKCQQDKVQGCNFFLWADDAEPRMQAAVLGNSRSEPVPAVAAATSRGCQAPPAPTSKQQLIPSIPSPPATKKRKLPWLDDSSEGSDDLSPGDEQILSLALESTMRSRLQSPPTTPRHKAIKLDMSETLHADPQGLPTPRTAETWKPSSPAAAGGSFPHTPDTTPTPARFRNALNASGSGGAGGAATPGQSQDPIALSQDVFSLLTRHGIKPAAAAASELRLLLDTYSARVLGIIKGRDATRAAIQTRDAAVARLQQRVDSLEAEAETSRALVAHWSQRVAAAAKQSGAG